MATKISLNDFLKQYFKLVRLGDMRDNHVEQWAHFEDMVSSGDMTKDQNSWADKLLQKDPSTGKFVRVPSPKGEYQIIAIEDDPTATPPVVGLHAGLENADWEAMFVMCRDTYLRMAQDRAAYAGNSKVLDFLNEWNHLFADTEQATQVATPATKRQFASLNDLLKNHPDVLKDLMENSGVLDGETKYQDLINGIKNSKYNTDDKFQEKVKKAARAIDSAFKDKNNPAHDELVKIGRKPQLSLIYDTYGPGWMQPDVDSAKVDSFKTQYHMFFKTLYKEGKVLEAYKAKENGDNRISNAVEDAKKSIDYNDTNSKNYITPKRDDVLTPMQQLQRWWSNTYEDSLKKYAELKGDRLFFSDTSKNIVKALDKAGIKPTVGLKGLLDKRADIAKILKSSSKGSEAFDWMIKTLDEFNNDPNMKNTMARALKNGRQMRNLISELIIKAVEDNKVEQAKAAMEVLSVMKYSATTSKIMDAFKGQDFKLFSDGGLSWNKNEGIQFVSKALDKSIKFAFKTVGYGLTIIGNEIRLSGSKYNKQFQHSDKDKSGAKLKQYSEAHDRNIATERATFDVNRIAADNADTANIARKTSERDSALTTLFTRNGAAALVDKEKAVNDEEKKVQTTLRAEQARKQEVLEPLQEELHIYEEILQLLKQKERYDAELNKYNTELTAASEPAQIRAIHARIDLLAEHMRQNDLKLAEYQQTIIDYNLGAYNPALTKRQAFSSTTAQTMLANIGGLSSAAFEAGVMDDFTRVDGLYDKADKDYQRIVAKIDRKERAISQFRSAQAEIKQLDDAMKERDKKARNWDKDHKNAYQELVAFWDMLESGRDSRTGSMYSWAPGSKKKKQQAFDANKQSIIDRYWSLTNQSYAA